MPTIGVVATEHKLIDSDPTYPSGGCEKFHYSPNEAFWGDQDRLSSWSERS